MQSGRDLSKFLKTVDQKEQDEVKHKWRDACVIISRFSVLPFLMHCGRVKQKLEVLGRAVKEEDFNPYGRTHWKTLINRTSEFTISSK